DIKVQPARAFLHPVRFPTRRYYARSDAIYGCVVVEADPEIGSDDFDHIHEAGTALAPEGVGAGRVPRNKQLHDYAVPAFFPSDYRAIVRKNAGTRDGESDAFRIAHVRAAQVRTAQVRIAQVRIAQVSTAQVRTAQVRIAQVSTAQVCLALTSPANSPTKLDAR